ncbi:MAG: hypothetical protein ACODAA_01510 [Gemmatimonadota bacterium]
MRRVAVAHTQTVVFLCLALTFAGPGSAAAQEESEPVPELPAIDPWAPEVDRDAQNALEELEEARGELGIVADSMVEVDPCGRPGGPNLVNFVRRGAEPGEPTYLYGIDLCSGRPFVYEEPTQTGVIVGLDANPPDIHWAGDLSDDRNLRGDRFPVELLVGVDMLFGTSTLDFGETASGSVDFAAAPSIGVRADRFRATFSHAVAPPERSWLVKFAVTPFRRGPPDEPAPVEEPAPTSHAERTTWFEPVGNPCNAPGVGIRGVDRMRIGHRRADRRYPVTLQMVSYCTRPYRQYSVRTTTDRTWFGQLNNTFPGFAAWDHIPRGGLMNNLSLSVGFGEILNDVFNVDFPTNVLYVGFGVAFGDSRWRVDAGRLITNEELEVISAGVPVVVSTDGWTVQVQRALHFDELFGR